MQNKIKDKLLEFRNIIHNSGKTSFTGKELCYFLAGDPVNARATNHNQVVEIVKERYADTRLARTYILSNENKGYTFESCGKKKYMFLDDYIRSKKGDNYLNIGNSEKYFGKDFPVFYDDSFQKYPLLQNPEELIRKLTIAYKELVSESIDSTGLAVDYKKVSNTAFLSDEFLTLINSLPFMDLQPVLSNPDLRKSFFINLYNVMNIHITVTYLRSKNFKASISSYDRIKLYDKYLYNVGGCFLSLNDVEHGVLRANDNFGKSLFTTGWKVLTGQSFSDSSVPRFPPGDIREKLVSAELDPRIHFALNCGAKSCPPIRVYEPDKIDQQLKIASINFCNSVKLKKKGKTTNTFELSQIFKWYQSDFSKDSKGLLMFIGEHVEGELKEAIDESVKHGKKHKIDWATYNWEINIK